MMDARQQDVNVAGVAANPSTTETEDDAFRAQWRRGSVKRTLVASAPSAPLSAAQKLEKHRMLVRRSYYQKKARRPRSCWRLRRGSCG